MSDPHPTETSWSNRTATFIGALGFIFLFLLILWIAYLPYRPEPIAQELGKERTETVRELRNQAIEENTTYGVVNEPEGIYRIPVEEAMRLTVEKYRTEKKATP